MLSVVLIINLSANLSDLCNLWEVAVRRVYVLTLWQALCRFGLQSVKMKSAARELKIEFLTVLFYALFHAKIAPGM